MNCNHILRWALALTVTIAAGAYPWPSLAQKQQAGGMSLAPLPVQAGAIKPGTWVRYSILRRQLKQQVLVELTALEHEAGGQWLELAITNSLNQTMVTKMLVGGQLSAPRGVLKAVIQLAGQRPLLLPPALTAKQVPPLQTGKDPQAKQLGKERVKVPAGTFLATKYRKRSGQEVTEIWLSDQVAGWSLVKLSSPKLLWQLIARGDAGKSRIQQKPQELPDGLLTPKAD